MKLTVTNVDRVMNSSGPKWFVKYSIERDPADDTTVGAFIDPEHTVFLHVFPEERIVSVIAEYDLDPDNMDEVMDVLLAEPFLDAGDGEPTLFSDEEPDLIRQAHRRRCARAKLAVRLSTRGIENPVEMVRSVPVDRANLARARFLMVDSMKAQRREHRRRNPVPGNGNGNGKGKGKTRG